MRFCEASRLVLQPDPTHRLLLVQTAQKMQAEGA